MMHKRLEKDGAAIDTHRLNVTILPLSYTC